MISYLLTLAALSGLHGGAALAVRHPERVAPALLGAAERMLDGGPLLAALAVGGCLMALDARWDQPVEQTLTVESVR